MQIINNISWLFFDKILRIAGGLLIGIWLARYLGAKDYGVLNYAIAYTVLFTLFVRLGLDQIVVRELVKFPEKTNELLGTAFVFKLGGAIAAIIFIFISLFFFQTDPVTKGVIIVISISFIAMSLDVIDFYFQSKVLSKYVVIPRNTAFIFSTALKIYFIINQYSVIYFAFVICMDGFLGGVFFLVAYRINDNKIRSWRYSRKIAKKYIKDCWPLAISTFLITIHMRVDQVMIGNMLDSSQVGIYSVAVNLSTAWYFIPIIFVNSLTPYFVKLKQNNSELYNFRLTQLYSFMFWMGASIGLITLIIGEKMLLFLFGLEYAGAYEALLFNIWNGIFVSQAVARGIWMINENLQKYRLFNNLIIVSINILLNVLLIPTWGISGSAFATLATQLIGTWLVPFFWKPLRTSTFWMLRSVNPVYLLKGL